MQQSLLPLGWTERNLIIRLRPDNRVNGLELTEDTYSYWIVLIHSAFNSEERSLDEEGQMHQQCHPSESGCLAMTNPWFVAGCFGCWGGSAIAFEYYLSDPDRNPQRVLEGISHECP
jgi:hypothetical protein